MKRTLTFWLAIGLAGMPPLARAADKSNFDAVTIRQEVDAVTQDYTAAINSLNPDEILKFTADAPKFCHVGIDGKSFDRAQFRQFLAGAFAGFSARNAVAQRQDILVLDPDTAFVVWHGAVELTRKEGGILRLDPYTVSCLFRRIRGSWRVVAQHESALPPRPVSSAGPPPAGYVVLHEVTGPIKTNAYLLYDRTSREAALIDVGGSVDSLTSAIDTRGLRLKYILNTHGHVDHVEGLAALRARYPEARWCMAREEFDDFGRYARWEEALAPDTVARIKAGMAQDPAMAATFKFDFSRLGAPDQFIGDGQTLQLGSLTIRCFLSPGHSRGGMCFVVGDALFSGDVLFYRRVGMAAPGVPEAEGRLTLSVRRLYTLLPDETTVYPGHGHFTEIGAEKLHNAQVQAGTGTSAGS